MKKSGKGDVFAAPVRRYSRKTLPAGKAAAKGQAYFFRILDPAKADRDFAVDDRVDHKAGRITGLGKSYRRPVGPGRVVGQDIQENIAVDKNRGHHSARVKAMIWSVDIATSPLPRKCATNRSPRPSLAAALAGTIRGAV